MPTTLRKCARMASAANGDQPVKLESGKQNLSFSEGLSRK